MHAFSGNGSAEEIERTQPRPRQPHCRYTNYVAIRTNATHARTEDRRPGPGRHACGPRSPRRSRRTSRPAAASRAWRPSSSATTRPARSTSATSARPARRPAWRAGCTACRPTRRKPQLLDLDRTAERRPGGPRHPGAAAAAEADRRGRGHPGRARRSRTWTASTRRTSACWPPGSRASCPARRSACSSCCVRNGIATAGQHVVVVGRSNIVGKPLALMLMQKPTTASRGRRRDRDRRPQRHARPAGRSRGRPTSWSRRSACRGSSRPTWSGPARW